MGGGMQLVRLLAGFLVIGPGVALAPTALGVTNFQQVNDRIYRRTTGTSLWPGSASRR